MTRILSVSGKMQGGFVRVHGGAAGAYHRVGGGEDVVDRLAAVEPPTLRHVL